MRRLRYLDATARSRTSRRAATASAPSTRSTATSRPLRSRPPPARQRGRGLRDRRRRRDRRRWRTAPRSAATCSCARTASDPARGRCCCPRSSRATPATSPGAARSSSGSCRPRQAMRCSGDRLPPRPARHFLAYPIPNVDGSVEPGRRLTNWLWYRNVAEGEDLDALMTDRARRPPAGLARTGRRRAVAARGVRAAAEADLPPPVAELVAVTAEPFVQVVFDIEVPRMAFGRACLLGDAAFALRPHAAVGSAKAAEDAWRLGEALRGSRPRRRRRARALGARRSSRSAGARSRARAARASARSTRASGGSASRCPGGCTRSATPRSTDR